MARPGLPTLLNYLATPLFLTAVCVWLYLYVQGRELDSIERRTLNQEFLTEKLREHISLAVVATLAVIAIAVPLGTLLTRPALRRLKLRS